MDFNKNYEKRQHLAKTLLPSDSNNGKLTLRFVAEPTSTSDGECEEFAETHVDLRKLYAEKLDLLNSTLPGTWFTPSHVILLEDVSLTKTIQ